MPLVAAFCQCRWLWRQYVLMHAAPTLSTCALPPPARTAGSAFLALFTLFMFVGPFGPGLPGSAFVSPGATGPELAALPAGAGAGAAAEHPRAGRALLQLAGSGDGGGAAGVDPFAMPVLPALPAAPSDAAAARSARATALAIADDAPGSPAASGKAGGGGQLAALWNATKASLWPAREALSAAQLEGLALQRLQVGAGE